MQNFVKQTGQLLYEASTDIDAGDVIDLDNLIAIAINDIASGETGPVKTRDIIEMVKEDGVAHSQGDLVYWTGTECTKTPGSNTLAGIVVEDAASAVLLVKVDINKGVPPRTASVSYSEIYKGSYTAVADDDTNGYAVIDTGLDEVPDGFEVAVLRAGVPVAAWKATALSTTDAGKIKVEDNSTYAVTADDEITVTAWLD